ncbi:MAG: nitrilase-related carbon-nitrogen hydrolase [Lentisphaeria bacterium]|jgi:predicted amidohydrolase|nr:nitrilase-related carbon-nitrogen hydrolase [Lentisphaeria bacterium]MDP7743713.1 nitrilase-related carbon-nitrogen hydrolase [Lentisphaeria bacterium]
MSNNIRISILAPLTPTVEQTPHGKPSVDWMRQYWRTRLADVTPEKPDLVALPEMCDEFSPLSNEVRLQYLDERGDTLLELFADHARRHSCYLTYPAVRELPDGTRRNSTQLLDRKGELVAIYNKNHCVVQETTEAGILNGCRACIAETDFGRVGFAICFDLNFDPLRLQYADLSPDVLVFSSVYHGGLMQQVWAYTCQTHFIGAVAGLPSGIINPIGETIAQTTNYRDHVSSIVNLDCTVAHYDCNWEKFAELRETHGAGVTIDDPGLLASVLITNHMNDTTIDQLVDTFGIERRRDYMKRALAFHTAPGHRETSG